MSNRALRRRVVSRLGRGGAEVARETGYDVTPPRWVKVNTKTDARAVTQYTGRCGTGMRICKTCDNVTDESVLTCVLFLWKDEWLQMYEISIL